MIREGVIQFLSMAMLMVVAGLLLVIAAMLLYRHGKARRRRVLQKLYSDFLSEVILCESTSELEDVLAAAPARLKLRFKKPEGRQVLLQEILHTKAHLNGQSAANLRWLYEELELYKESLILFKSGKWYKKATGIQQLARMDQKRFLKRIYKETDHPNHFVRNEAQVAVVALIGFDGLRFLNFIHYPLTQWQQLSLLETLHEQHVESDRLVGWLKSHNATVVEFALRLVEKYKCFDLQHDVMALLDHPLPAVRHQALLTLKEIFDEDSCAGLVQHFGCFSLDEKLMALELIAEHGKKHHLSFLQALLSQPDELVRYAAYISMRRIKASLPGDAAPDYSDVYYLPALKKEIV